MIKIGSNHLSLKDTSIEDFIKVAYDLNLDCVDFHERNFEDRNPATLSSIKMLCLRHGLPIGYIGISMTFVGNSEERAAGVQKCKDAIDLAAFLGSTPSSACSAAECRRRTATVMTRGRR